MKAFMLAVLGIATLSLPVAAATGPAQAAAPSASEMSKPMIVDNDGMNLMVEDNCIMCHSDAAKTGGLTLESFDAAHIVDNAEITEKMIRKLRTGMMPPSYAPQPEPEAIDALAEEL